MDKDLNTNINSASNKLIVGVTGGIGAGKTAVTDIFQQLGVTVVDADQVAREVVQPSSPALNKIIDAFGQNIVLENGQLNRPKLRQLIFTDNSAKQTLNNIMFPAIRTELLSQLAKANSPYVILSAPLLIENNLHQYTTRVLVVDVPEEIQLERAVARDKVSKEQVQSIIASQISRKERLSFANDVIDNSKAITSLPQKVTNQHRSYLEML